MDLLSAIHVIVSSDVVTEPLAMSCLLVLTAYPVLHLNFAYYDAVIIIMYQ